MIDNLFKIPSIALIFIVSLPSYSNDNDEFDTINKNSHLDVLLKKKLESYQHLYPDITFLNLKGGNQLVANMFQLDNVLGPQPASLDYEHPPELRSDLMYVSMNRIVQMLQYSIPSSALFKADEELEPQPTVCVLTINPQAVASDSYQATENLLGMQYEFVKKIPRDKHIGSTDYLSYLVDHEVYHCLQSIYVGPQPMSNKNLWGEYWHHLSEFGADAYALTMHIKRQGKVTSFVKNVNRIRGSVLLTADPNHLTCKAIEQLYKIPPNQITAMTEKDVFNLALEIRNSLTMSYDSFLQFMASAVEAMNVLGVDPQLSEEAVSTIANVKADPERVKTLINRTRKCLAELGG